MAEEKVTLELLIDARRAKQGAQEFADASKKAETAAKGVTEAQERQTASMSRGDAILQRVTRRLVNYFGVYQGIRLVREAISTLATFEETMVVVQGVAQASAADLDRLTEAARHFGAVTRFSATEAGQALLELSKAGFSVNEALAALPSILTLAQASQLGLGEAADIASKAVRQFKLEAEDAMRIVDDFVVVANKSNADVRGIADAMKFVGPIAASFGLAIEEVAAAIGVLSDSGIQGAMAGTNLRQMLASLANPTKETKETLQRLGVAVKDLSPSTTTLTQMLMKLKEANLSAEDATKAFTTRSASAVLILSSNVAKLKELEEAQKKSRGEAQRLADMMDKTLIGGFKNLQSAVEELMLRIGDSGLGATVSKLTLLFTDVFRVLSRTEQGTKTFVSGARLVASWIRYMVVAAETWIALKMAANLLNAARALGQYVNALVMAKTATERLALLTGALKLGLFALASVGTLWFNHWITRLHDIEQAHQDVLKAVRELTTAQKLLAGAASPMERFERSTDVLRKSIIVVQEELKKTTAIMDDFIMEEKIPKLNLGTKEEIDRIRDLIAIEALRQKQRKEFEENPFFDLSKAKDARVAVEAMSIQLDILVKNQGLAQAAISETFTVLKNDVAEANRLVKEAARESGAAPQAFVDAQLVTLTKLRDFMDKVIGEDILRGMGEASGITSEALAEVAKLIEDLDGKARKAGAGTKGLAVSMEDGADAADDFGKGTQTAAAAATSFLQTLEKQIEASKKLTPEQQRAKLGLDAIGIAFRLSTAEMEAFLMKTAPLLIALRRIQEATEATERRKEGMAEFMNVLEKVQDDQRVALIINDREAEQTRQLLALEETLAEKTKMTAEERNKYIQALREEFAELNRLNDVKKEEIRLRDQRFEKLRKEGEAMQEALTSYDEMLKRYKEEVQLHKDLDKLRNMSISIGKRQISLLTDEAGQRQFVVQVIEDENLALEKLQTLREAEKKLRDSGISPEDVEVLIRQLEGIVDAAQAARQRTDALAQMARNSALAFDQFFNAIVFGAADAGDALEALTMQLVQMLAQQLFFQPLSAMIGNQFASFFKFLIPAQHGAVLTQPTVIPASGVPTPSGVLAAEAGREEAVMPLARTPSGDLGVRTVGGVAPVIVHAHFHGVRNMDEFRRSKKQVISSLERGVRKSRETAFE